MKHILLSFLFFVLAQTVSAQNAKRVLFLGNSYTGYNNLPQLVTDVAQSLGDTLVTDRNTPGGYTLNGHSTNVNSQNKIAQGGWDYVVLQEQSQLPSFPFNQYANLSLPFADSLCRQIRQADSCAIPLFYMTWGRKNGDQQNCAAHPPVCTYAGMQHLLRERYVLMANTNNAQVSPVGAVWRDVRSNYSSIELYNPDESHPSLAGSYLAACTFYASIFHKSPVGAAIPGAINQIDGAAIQQQVAATVFDSLGVWMIDTLKPHVDFAWSQFGANCELQFDASFSQNVDSIYWDFGDGVTGSGLSVQHTYSAGGTYTVCAEGWKGCEVDYLCQNGVFCFMDINEKEIKGLSVYPIPTLSYLQVAELGEDALNALFTIYNLSGKLLIEGEDASLINVSELAAGIYILEIRLNNRVSRLRFEKI